MNSNTQQQPPQQQQQLRRSTSTESVSSTGSSGTRTGIQSSYVQRQIERQKMRGNWNNSIAPPPPSNDINATVDDDTTHDRTAIATKSNTNNSNNSNNVRGISIEEGLGGGLIFTHLPTSSSLEKY